MIDSPCIDICTIDNESGLCVGCGRNLEEITKWNVINNMGKKQILTKIKTRYLKKKSKITKNRTTAAD